MTPEIEFKKICIAVDTEIKKVKRNMIQFIKISKGKINYGHIGSIAHVKSLLGEVNSFFSSAEKVTSILNLIEKEKKNKK